MLPNANPTHFVVARMTLMTVVPFYDDISQMNGCDLPAIRLIAVEAHAIANL